LPTDIDERLASIGEALSGVDAVVFAYLFGSAARGELAPSSDVDVAVFLDERTDPVEGRLAATVGLARHLGTDALDVVVLNSAPTALVGRVLVDRVVVLDRHPFRRHAFESKALREFHDFRLLERRLLERKFGRG
jgi:predicted nucleotidyltransferase